jgi:hypothetical protein
MALKGSAAKINQLAGLSTASHHDVFWFQIAMN